MSSPSWRELCCNHGHLSCVGLRGSLARAAAPWFSETPCTIMKSNDDIRLSAAFCHFLHCFRVRGQGAMASTAVDVGLHPLGVSSRY